HLFAPPCLVHQGFRRALNRVWDQVHGCVKAYRQNWPNAEICFTGHSLGGALATLAFSRFADPGSCLITFGGPRVGNDVFRDRVLSNPAKRIFRYVNRNDTVPHVPLESFFAGMRLASASVSTRTGSSVRTIPVLKATATRCATAVEGVAGDFTKL